MARERCKHLFWAQLKAMLIRNIYLKKRDTRKTLAEILVPLYSLGVLVLMKYLIPNPNFPEISVPRGEAHLFEHFKQNRNHTIAVAPNSTDVLDFLDAINDHLASEPDMTPINWMPFHSEKTLLNLYWSDPSSVPMAVIFLSNPMTTEDPLRYKIRANPSLKATPSTRSKFSSPATCRIVDAHWTSGMFPIQGGEMCPVNQYYYSGFLALQAIIDFTKIKLDAGLNSRHLFTPSIMMEMFPKHAFTGNWLLAFRIVIPIYMVITLSQFLTYLLMLVVGEKESKIREGMRITGLMDSVYWISWFILYAVFVLILSVVCTVLLFTLKVFQHSSYILIFLLILLFGFSIIVFSFMLTPFFDKSRTAGIVGSFAVNIISLLYFIQIFVSNADSVALWLVSLISSSGFALAMDKALVLDMAGVGASWDNLWQGPGLPFGGCLIMMALDTFIYGLLAYYLDAVIPSEHGIKRKPWFFLLPSFWCGSKHKGRDMSHFTSNGETNHTNDGDIEPVPRELLDKEAIRIVSLYKSFHNCRRAEVKAVDGIDLSIYEGQITAVLGHNGAGKSTLFNILTGLTAPTCGTAYIYGLDIRNPQDMNEIRRMTGVCPQHDILFDKLTVRQHLTFFASIRGIPSRRIESAVTRAMQEVSLTEKASTFAKHLSGGQKRKLSVAIAIIGDPKIIILDEPTAGVDPISRRHMWRILQRLRQGKVLLLTTHFMDEADILGDRKAVITKGKLRCAGTSLFLKNKFGIGYHLTLVLDSVCRENQITRLVTSRVSRAEKARRHGRELSYILPHNAVHAFANLFRDIEDEIANKTNRLGICSYGVSMTTLEEVFLHLEGEGSEEAHPVDGLSRKLVRARALSRSLSLQSKSPSYQELFDHSQPPLNPIASPNGTNGPVPNATHALHATNHGLQHVKVQNPQGTDNQPPSLSLLSEHIQVSPNTCQILNALIQIRILRMIRDPYKLYLLIILPILFAELGLYVKSQGVSFFKMHALTLNSQLYTNITSIAIHNNGNEDIKGFVNSLGSMGVWPVNTSYDGNFSSLLQMNNMAAFNITSLSLADLSLYLVYNDTYTHGLPVIVNFLSNALYRMNMENAGKLDSWKPISVSTHPFQATSEPEEFDIGITSCALLMGMIFVLVPVSLAIEMVYDREIKAKNQLRVNGLSLSMYFVSYFVVLTVIMLVITAALIILIFLHDIPSLRETNAIIVLTGLLILYCPSSILFSTSLSYMFDHMESAQSFLPNIATWVGLIPFLVIAILDMLRLSPTLTFGLHVTFSLLNTMYIPYAVIYYVDRVYIACGLRTWCIAPTIEQYFTKELIVLAVGCILHIPFWGMATKLLDAHKTGRGLMCDKWKVKPASEDLTEEEMYSGVSGEEDGDVRRERRKVAALLATPPPNPPALMVHNLRKEYKQGGTCNCSGGCDDDTEQPQTHIALARLSLDVEPGEVFGLLGHNGAGKTTTMKIITAEEAPTQGTVVLGGHNIAASPDGAFQLLGYCPQHDALWKNITIMEHLRCYAAIRGVPQHHIESISRAYLEGLQMSEHANKHADECSGGTRRKLSFAMAMLGSPRLVLLDEPSTGMDPRSKRFLWDTILASFQGKKGAILTTHSMEEADALCSRVGIMVKGSLRCIGSTQHLKNMYGAGYTLEMKIVAGGSDAMSPAGATVTSPSLEHRLDGGTSPSLGEGDERESLNNTNGEEEDTTAELADENVMDVNIHTPLVADGEIIGDTSRPLSRMLSEEVEATGVDAARSFVTSLFPSSKMEESFADRLVFSVPQNSVSSLANIFAHLEAAKERLGITEYSFSQTTLEQVFLKFAQYEDADGPTAEPLDS